METITMIEVWHFWCDWFDPQWGYLVLHDQHPDDYALESLIDNEWDDMIADWDEGCLGEYCFERVVMPLCKFKQLEPMEW